MGKAVAFVSVIIVLDIILMAYGDTGILCSVPTDPVNGRVNYSSLEYGTELKYECNAGFLLNKHHPRICSENGSWSNEEPECIEATCEEPQPPKHGTVKLHGDLKVGSLATYSCNPDRILYGASTTKCLISGKWTFDTPECLSSCKVPYIENGDMGRHEIQYIRWRSRMEFKKVLPGEDANSGDTVSLRCRNGSLPVKNSEFVESNLLEVTCSDGTWSTDLQCKQTKCNGTPPVGKNARRVIGGRDHGYTIYYACDINYRKLKKGNVRCHFGSWIGVPPICLFYGKDRATSIIEPGVTPSALEITPNIKNMESSSHPTSDMRGHEDCFCSYEFEDQLVNAYIGRRTLKLRDKIRRREVVSFECKFHGRVLTWQNGLRLSGKANVTCNTCKAWERKDVPVCKNLEMNDAVISYNNNFLPGRIINIQKQERQRFSCSNIWKQPDWDYGQRRGVSVSKIQIPGIESVHYISYLDIDNDADDISGGYECYVNDNLGQRSGSTSLHLQVNDTKCSIHNLSISIPEGIEPDISNVTGEYVMFGSKVKLICTDNSVMNGDAQAQCGEHGKWKLGHFECVEGCILNLDPSSHLLVQPKKDNYQVGESVLLSCPEGEEMSAKVERIMCLPSRWSDSLPECKEPGKKDER